MKAPVFWSNPPSAPGLLSWLLLPCAWGWRLAGVLRRLWVRPERVGVPVLCVGNLTAGGTGKTPMVAALLRYLGARGVRAHVISRGYGGRRTGPHRVDYAHDDYRDVGDEPLLLAPFAPVWVARDRLAGAWAAVDAGAELILLDDGFQNPALIKDASIIMIDAAQGFGNGRIIPAGPLREPVRAGLARADLTVLVGHASARAHVLSQWPDLGQRPSVGAEMLRLPTGIDLAGERVIAFAGIGRPSKFFETVAETGADIVARHAFSDHHAYGNKILRRLRAESLEKAAMLVTTEKDALRLPPWFRCEVTVIMAHLEPDNWDAIAGLLDKLGIGSQQKTNKHIDGA